MKITTKNAKQALAVIEEIRAIGPWIDGDTKLKVILSILKGLAEDRELDGFEI